MEIDNTKICIIGLGYVGLPLAVEFGKKFDVIGYDINKERVELLREGIDNTLECSNEEIQKSKRLTFSSNEIEIGYSNFYVITVPTPIDRHNDPDLSPLQAASILVGKYLKKGDIVVYESTVYPGCTEEFCVPILENISGLEYNKDFYCGYSPERINPGDKKHKVNNIMKVTSGSNEWVAKKVNYVYSAIIDVGTYNAGSIKIAEAAKIIENTQRDLNIALINELSIIFKKLEIDTESVLLAAGTKWNFINFRPGLVGGHCIGVDPYYLTYKAKEMGYIPEIILAGRRLNDSMGVYIASEFIKNLIKKQICVTNAKILILGLTFKENCPDIRNSKVVDIYKELVDYGINVSVYDPHVNKAEALAVYEIPMIDTLNQNQFDGIIITVAHEEFRLMGIDKIRNLCKNKKLIFDVKSIFSESDSDWRL